MRFIPVQAPAAVDPLADRIASCLREADARRLPAVGAHLDAALLALTGAGLWPEEEVDRRL